MDAPRHDKVARNREIDWERCIICQKPNNKKQKLVCPAKSKKDDRGPGIEHLYATLLNLTLSLIKLMFLI